MQAGFPLLLLHLSSSTALASQISWDNCTLALAGYKQIKLTHVKSISGPSSWGEHSAWISSMEFLFLALKTVAFPFSPWLSYYHSCKARKTRKIWTCRIFFFSLTGSNTVPKCCHFSPMEKHLLWPSWLSKMDTYEWALYSLRAPVSKHRYLHILDKNTSPKHSLPCLLLGLTSGRTVWLTNCGMLFWIQVSANLNTRCNLPSSVEMYVIFSHKSWTKR